MSVHMWCRMILSSWDSHVQAVVGTSAPHASLFFFFNDTATTEIYTLSLHDALPIWADRPASWRAAALRVRGCRPGERSDNRSEEHTSELQSRSDLVCRLLLEKKKYHRPDTKPCYKRPPRNATVVYILRPCHLQRLLL